jgi:membrane associated rhomboid family serine protease
MNDLFPQDPRFPDKKAENDNVVPFGRRGPERPKGFSPPPMLNIPTMTRIMALSLIVVHLALEGLGFFFGTQIPSICIVFGGFIPASWTGGNPFEWWTPLTLISYNFLHGGWFHLIMNVLMIVTFGSGVERWIGPKKFLQILIGSSLIAAATHLAFAPTSQEIVVGASGGISGLFGAMLVHLQRSNAFNRHKTSLVPTALVWIAITALFGYLGAPDGSSVAWVAHIGGFLGGIGLTLMFLKSPQV